MRKSRLLKKGLAVAVVFFFICILLPSYASPARSYASSIPAAEIFFGLQSMLDVTWDESATIEPIIPRGELRFVGLNVSFWVTWGMFGHLISRLYRGRSCLATVSIVDAPSWCTATIAQQYLYYSLPGEENSPHITQTVLSLQVADDAPAFERFPVTIQATMKPIRGFLGLMTVLHGTTQTVNITFSVAYKPLLKTTLPQGNTIETPPLVQMEFPIVLENLGNGKTVVQNELLNYPEGWAITLPEFTVLDVNEEVEIDLTIQAPANFTGEKCIVVGFTPHSYENYSLMGTPVFVSFLVYYYPR